MQQDYNLEQPIMRFKNENGTTNFTIRDSFNGIQIFGGIGSGKTTGSGKFMAKAMLGLGYGGLVLTAKIDEADAWKRYCAETGRTNDLIILEPCGEHCFNFLEYESKNRPAGFSISDNILVVLKTIIKAREEKSSGKSDDQFWTEALDMLITNALDLCLLAYSELSVQTLYDIVLTAPKADAKPPNPNKPHTFAHAFKAAQTKVNAQVKDHPMLSGIEDPDETERLMLKHIPEARLLKSIDDYFIENFRTLSPKTRGIIEHCFLGFLFRLLREPARSLVCADKSTFDPEDSLNGKILLINLPVKKFEQSGCDIQALIKFVWQRAMERRDVTKNGRPVFLYADEAQHFLLENDAIFSATARSSRIATIYLTQNLNGYHANMGGIKSKYRVMGFLGTMSTKIFHCNADIESNIYASQLIGKGFTKDISESNTIAGEFSSTEGSSFKLEDMVRPEEFGYLKTGGPENKNTVEAYIHMQGKKFPNGFNYFKIAFRQ